MTQARQNVADTFCDSTGDLKQIGQCSFTNKEDFSDASVVSLESDVFQEGILTKGISDIHSCERGRIIDLNL